MRLLFRGNNILKSDPVGNHFYSTYKFSLLLSPILLNSAPNTTGWLSVTNPLMIQFKIRNNIWQQSLFFSNIFGIHRHSEMAQCGVDFFFLVKRDYIRFRYHQTGYRIFNTGGMGVWIGESRERKGYYYFLFEPGKCFDCIYSTTGRVLLLQMIEYVMYTY